MAHANECGIVKNSFHFLSQQANYIQYALHFQFVFIPTCSFYFLYQFSFPSILVVYIYSHHNHITHLVSCIGIVYSRLSCFLSFLAVAEYKAENLFKIFLWKIFYHRKRFSFMYFHPIFCRMKKKCTHSIYIRRERIGNMRKENIVQRRHFRRKRKQFWQCASLVLIFCCNAISKKNPWCIASIYCSTQRYYKNEHFVNYINAAVYHHSLKNYYRHFLLI